jgi:hypothetical protein
MAQSREAPRWRDLDARRSQQGGYRSFRYPPGQHQRNALAHRRMLNTCLGRSIRKWLEALQKTTSHVGAWLHATGTRMMARHLVRTGNHDHCIGLGRRERNAGRNGDQCQRHGEHAHDDKGAVQHVPHGHEIATAGGRRQERHSFLLISPRPRFGIPAKTAAKSAMRT